MSIFVELHALRSFPPSNLNRDDLGTPKTALFGASRRLRISSQCLKRTWRMAEQFRGDFAATELGIRTDRLPSVVLEQLGKSIDEPARSGLLALLGSLGKKDKKAAEDGEAADALEAAGEDEDAGEEDQTRTAHLLFLSRQEIEAVAGFAKERAEQLSKIYSKKKVSPDQLKKLRGDLLDYLEEKTTKNAVDVGLFGRFVTSDEFDTIDAALQVAPALGTQKVEIEYDYFTAVDDLSQETGAGHLGETEFASSVLYLYACCDLGQLERNLGKRSAEGRKPDDEARLLARKSLPALVKAMALATPTGKKTGTAPHTPAEFIEVVVRRGAPLSFANAFLKPVDAREENGDIMAASISRYGAHRDAIEVAYGRDKDSVERFVLCLRDAKGMPKGTNNVATLKDLGDRLAAALKALPAQAS